MLYLDSAVLVALHCEETSTPSIRRWIARQREVLVISEWVLTECASAFGLKVRRAEMKPVEAELAIDSIERLADESLEILPIAPAHYRQARQWLRTFDHGLRAADALHLAIAHETGCRLATYDNVLLRAAKLLKVRAAKTA